MYKVISLPDFFVDRIIKVPFKKEEFINMLQEKESGNIIIENQKIKYGGNATNFSITLGKLGVRNTLVVETDEFGKKLLEFFIGNLPVHLIVIEGLLNMTVALEFGTNNIMLSDPKGIRNFGPDKLPEEVIKLLEKADYICLFNWNQNLKSNELVEFISEIKTGKLYLDIGDPTVAIDRLPNLVRLLQRGEVDILSLNENELLILAKHLKIFGNNLFEISKRLFKKLNLEHLDIHTKDFGISLPDEVIVYTELIDRSKIVNITGAGDTWNAGNIYGYINKFSPEMRIKFAHKVAKQYILGLL